VNIGISSGYVIRLGGKRERERGVATRGREKAKEKKN